MKSFVNGIKNLKTIAYWRKAKFSGIFAKKDYTKVVAGMCDHRPFSIDALAASPMVEKRQLKLQVGLSSF